MTRFMTCPECGDGLEAALPYYENLVKTVQATFPELAKVELEKVVLHRPMVAVEPLNGGVAFICQLYGLTEGGRPVVHLSQCTGVETVIHELIHVNNPELSEFDVRRLEDEYIAKFLKAHPFAWSDVKKARQPLLSYQLNAFIMWVGEYWPWLLGLGGLVAGGLALWSMVQGSGVEK